MIFKSKIIEQPLRKRTAVNLEINAQRTSQAQPGSLTLRETLSSTTLMNDSDVVNRSGPVALLYRNQSIQHFKALGLCGLDEIHCIGPLSHLLCHRSIEITP